MFGLVAILCCVAILFDLFIWFTLCKLSSKIAREEEYREILKDKEE